MSFRYGTLPGVLSAAATIAAIVLLGVVCAHWFWRFAEPPAVAALPPAAQSSPALESIRNARLFGGAPPAALAAASGRSELVLRGVSVTSNGGLALIALDRGRTVVVRAGDEIAPGVRLERVRHDHVVIDRQGVRERLELARAKSMDATPGAPAGAARR